jgi:hypothetical protein
MVMPLRRLLREPLLHFLLIGVALFAAYNRVSPAGAGVARIVVTQGVVDDLVTQHLAARGRAPSATELGHLIDAWVREEILYREGVTLGLDRDDIVVKRRVRQKLEVMAEEDASTAAPTDADLNAYLAAHPDRFVQPAVLTFEQIFVGHATAGPEVRLTVARVRNAVQRGDDLDRLGKSSLLPQRMTQVPADLVARDFGTAFAEALEYAPIGTWTGPIEGSYGSHFARVTARTPSRVPRLDDVRDQVVREWENERRQRARDEGYAKMRGKYEIEIEASGPEGNQR